MSTGDSWLLPLIAVGVGFHLAVSWALLWRYFQGRERSLVTWAVAWFILALHVLGMFLTRRGFEANAPVLRDVSLAAAAVALYLGQAQLSGFQFETSTPFKLGAGATAGLAALLIIFSRSPVTTASATVAFAAFAAAAWLASPLGTSASRDTTRWLLFAGYGMAAFHSLSYVIPQHAAAAAPLEIAGHALFSLLFSAAVTWQAWEHEQAVRLFSRTLERLNRPLSTNQAMQEALDLVADVLDVSQGWIILRSQGRGGAEGGWTIGAAIGFPGWSLHGVQGPDFPIDTCLCLRPVDPDSLVTSVSDLACMRLPQEHGRPSGRHITIPLGSDGKVQGIMSLLVSGEGVCLPKETVRRGVEAQRLKRTTDPGTLRLLNAMGEQIGLALDRARLYDELKAKEEARGRLLAQLITATEDERRRIARELHDETGQSLTALVVNLDFLVRHPVGEDVLRQRLASVRDMAEATLAEVRRVIHEMRPSVLDDLGLEAAVRWLVRRFEPSGLNVSIEMKGLGGRLPGPLEITVFRLVQEACTNTVKHAGASGLGIRISHTGERMDVEVRDNGKGFDPAALSAGAGAGMGLAGLRERVLLLGGTLEVRSAPGTGTTILARLPVGLSLGTAATAMADRAPTG